MMRFFSRWAIGAVALYLTVQLGHQLGFGLSFVQSGMEGNVVGAFAAALVLTLVNAFVRPIVQFLTLPLSCLTFGLFGLVVNALMFYIVGRLNVGLEVDTFVSALFGSLVMGALLGILNTFLGGDKNEQRR